MNNRYKVHPDFRMANLMHAPTEPVGVNALNYLNQRAIDRIEAGPNVTLEHLIVPGDEEHGIPVILIRPVREKGLRPCYVHLHGGGFMLKTSPIVVKNMMEYAERAGCVVLLPDYRLLPDHPFPAAFNDTCRVLGWLASQGHLFGLDRTRVAIGGQSAGGALAAGAVLWARDQAINIKLLLQILIYPVVDYLQTSESLKEFWDAPVWDAEKNQKMWTAYLPEEPVDGVGYASPIHHKDLEGLPKAYIELAEYDCLRDEGMAYAKALKDAGNDVKVLLVDGGVHGYDNFLNSAYVDTFVNKRIKLLRKVFSKGGEDRG